MSLTPMVEEIVKNCVLEPDSVSVEEAEDRGAMIYTVTVAPNDVGRIIGKDGRVISCIRQVVGAAGAKARSKAIVKVKTD
jgi:predicted RNA-binding protein YlqC (UPF0109 family)